MTDLETERLLLRRWQDSDLSAFAAINQDDQVTEFLPRKLSIAESKQLMEIFNEHISLHGFGLYACALKASNTLIGFVGLNIPTFTAYFTPCVEIGWRLAAQYWGQGYATEAARAVLSQGFQEFELDEIVAFTAQQNLASRCVMARLGMHYNAEDDFNHPNLTPEHALSRHVLYRIKNYLCDVYIGTGDLNGNGVYAKRDFKAGEVIIPYRLQTLTPEQYKKLSENEKLFVHNHHGVLKLYSEPERYVNHSATPNTCQDLIIGCDRALRDIKKGEAITGNASKDDVV